MRENSMLTKADSNKYSKMVDRMNKENLPEEETYSFLNHIETEYEVHNFNVKDFFPNKLALNHLFCTPGIS